jgi:metal-sulfur cluster biosynthetic enzyme
MELNISDENYQTKMIALAALHQVADPELGINIVDLGLVYNIVVKGPEKEILVDMTLSTPSCPLGSFITGHVTTALKDALPQYNPVVNLVWEPKWNADMITPQGKAELGW